MSHKRQVEGSGERSQRGCVWQFRDKGVRVDIELFLLDSGTEIEVQTSLEAFLNELVIEGNASDFVEGRWDEVVGAVFLIELLPLLEFLFSEQVLPGWVVGLVVTR